MKEMLVIVPSRNRSKNIQDFYDLFIANSEISDLCIGIDEDESEDYPKLNNVIYDVNPNMKLCPKLNLISSKYIDQYKYICFLGDDVRIKTKGWDSILTVPLQNKAGIAYGNDLLQGKALPTGVVISSSIIKTLGYMVPPELKHFYMDNFLLDLGNKINRIYYFDNVTLEHLHYANGKAEIDKTYMSANTADEDFQSYTRYISNSFSSDIIKVKGILGE